MSVQHPKFRAAAVQAAPVNSQPSGQDWIGVAGCSSTRRQLELSS